MGHINNTSKTHLVYIHVKAQRRRILAKLAAGCAHARLPHNATNGFLLQRLFVSFLLVLLHRACVSHEAAAVAAGVLPCKRMTIITTTIIKQQQQQQQRQQVLALRVEQAHVVHLGEVGAADGAGVVRGDVGGVRTVAAVLSIVVHSLVAADLK